MLMKLPRRFRAHRLRIAVLRYQLLGYCLFLLPLAVWLITCSLTNRSNLTFPRQLQKATNVLLVFAHPDDDSLFFGPTILQLTRRKDATKTHLLFLSTGNHYGLGSLRKLEQRNSCAIFGVPDEHCKVLDLPELQDDPTAVWPQKKIQAVVADHVKKWSVDTIITFDDHGVSGHKNHIAVSDAIVAYTTQAPLPPPVVTYTLTSRSVLRKYASIADLPLTVLGHLWYRVFSFGGGESALSVNSVSMWWRGVRAFQQHETQNGWDRKIYAVLSRYMFFNELRRVEVVYGDDD